MNVRYSYHDEDAHDEYDENDNDDEDWYNDDSDR